MTPPIKPQVAVIDGKLNVFMGADYKLLDRPAAKTFMRDIQRGYAQLLREEKRKKRATR
jgi:hypothetical protein